MKGRQLWIHLLQGLRQDEQSGHIYYMVQGERDGKIIVSAVLPLLGGPYGEQASQRVTKIASQFPPAQQPLAFLGKCQDAVMLGSVFVVMRMDWMFTPGDKAGKALNVFFNAEYYASNHCLCVRMFLNGLQFNSERLCRGIETGG